MHFLISDNSLLLLLQNSNVELTLRTFLRFVFQSLYLSNMFILRLNKLKTNREIIIRHKGMFYEIPMCIHKIFIIAFHEKQFPPFPSSKDFILLSAFLKYLHSFSLCNYECKRWCNIHFAVLRYSYGILSECSR